MDIIARINTIYYRLQGTLRCLSGKYPQYQPGVCGWCGKPHVKVAQKWKDYPPLDDSTEQTAICKEKE